MARVRCVFAGLTYRDSPALVTNSDVSASTLTVGASQIRIAHDDYCIAPPSARGSSVLPAEFRPFAAHTAVARRAVEW
jgi:hypothetical protein